MQVVIRNSQDRRLCAESLLKSPTRESQGIPTLLQKHNFVNLPPLSWILTLLAYAVMCLSKHEYVFYSLHMYSEFFTHLETVFIFNTVLCLLAGFIIGLERESRGKDAGISTHTLVIMGSMLFTFISAVVDPTSSSRIAAQVVTGIGYLGAGLILKDGTIVRNLTTAASLWFSAAIGMAIGFNLYIVATIATLVCLVATRIPHLYDRRSNASETTTHEKTSKQSK